MTNIALSSRTILFATAATLAFGFASPAIAQQEQQQPPPQEDQSATDVDQNAIVITAQKREEKQQDIPISISVVKGEQLVKSGATQLTEIAGYIPGFQVSTQGAPGQAILTLRGIPPLGGNATVGTYVDDGPVGASTAYTESGGFTVDLLPYDLNRIEVLRGPQGTLYGASTLGGLIKYVTRAPDLDEFRGQVGVEGFTINNAGDLGYAFQGFLNAPIVMDRLAVTASFAHRRTPGWIDNVQTGEKDQNSVDQTGYRGSLLWQPTDNFHIRLSAMHQKIHSDSSAIIVEDVDGNPIGNGHSNFNFVPESFKSKFLNLAGTAEYDFGFAALSSTTTYTDTKRTEVQDGTRLVGVLLGIPVTPFQNVLTLEKITEEIRLTSPSGERFEWLLGYFFTDEDAGNDQTLRSFDSDLNPLPGLDPLYVAGLPSTYKEHALFGNATFRVTDQFWLTGGLRWAHNEQTFKQLITSDIIPDVDEAGTSDESIVTYSISPQFHLNDDTMFYARVATGYRPGGPNVALPGVPPSFDPDTITNYELGAKTSLADRTVNLDVALFHMNWKDIQVNKAFGGTSGLANGNGARSNGIEAAVLWRPVSGLSFGANAAFTDAELTDDAPEIGGLKGDRLADVPKFSGSLTADYNFRIGGHLAEIGAGVRHTGKRVSDVGPSFTGEPGDPANKLNISSYTALDLFGAVTFYDRFKVRAYVRNLTDDGGPITRGVVRNLANGPAYISVAPVQPRTVGLALDAEF
ncbi:TonB-dependent receptor [Sphingomonas hankyongi]|uniref:TonB-dependent receptor n=1 Tax=Sphingomonas hankyongi TaxID=2908209 RepID=A0ABT0S2Z4_9SPHN|nr:TonB-dependent receptor [Sphingomonas hankyongi]MCL6730201.1 TonB-dependent receptor [Sphingomonas hankyongi]